ncbi:MAG: hypothetical protein BM557_01550 [Flavobacterium sp. MedPE-SWcel]|nr:MAG: hypothetical protein BM557_01550 [Flavobacterium sp. MedPE-SWcel]
MAGGDNKGKYKRERKISESYTVNPDASLFVDNKYGSIFVTTWDENKIAIDVSITVSGNRERTVDKRFNSIDVDFSATQKSVNARTRIGRFSGGSINLEINYTIKIPKNGTVDLDNMYGDIKLGKINGRALIKCKYGDFSADSLNNNSNNINVQYGSFITDFMKSGLLRAQYSEVRMDKSENLETRCEYTDLTINDVENIKYISNYGNVRIGTAKQISGESSYSDFKIDKLHESIDIKIEYGDVKASMAKSVKNVLIDASYTDVLIDYDPNTSFDFEFWLEYGSLNTKADLKYSIKKENHYKGYYGTKGRGKINVKSEYGAINIKM